MRRVIIIFYFLSISSFVFSQKQTLDSLVGKIPQLSEKNYRQHLLLVYQHLSEQDREHLLPISIRIIEIAQKSSIPAVRIYTSIQVAKVLNYKNIKEGVDISLDAYWAAKSKNLLFETAEAAELLAYIYNMAENNEKTLRYALEASDAYQKLEKIDLHQKIEKQRAALFEVDAELHTDLKVRYVYAVRAYAESILYNLISNAIKYRSPEKKLLVHIKTYQDDTNFYLEVSDNGIGIDLERHQDKMFGIYKHFHTIIEGKGLGLHIVKLQVEAMGGKIEVSSKINEGTTFKMTFKKPKNVLQELKKF